MSCQSSNPEVQLCSSSFHVPEGYKLPAGVMALQNLPADAVAEAAIAAALLLEHTPLGASLLLRPGALTALLDTVLDENSASLPEHAHRKASFSSSGNTQFLSCRLCQSLRTCWRSRVLAAASSQALSLINEGFYKMKLKQHWHECPCRHNAYVVTVTARFNMPGITTGAEATEALAGAAQWLLKSDAPNSRRTTGSDSGEAAATGPEAKGGTDSVPASAAPAKANGPSANGHADAAAGVSPKSQQDARATESDGIATPSGNFETMTFHVGGALTRRVFSVHACSHTCHLPSASGPHQYFLVSVVSCTLCHNLSWYIPVLAESPSS
jgi:hypothetical protein